MKFANWGAYVLRISVLSVECSIACILNGEALDSPLRGHLHLRGHSSSLGILINNNLPFPRSVKSSEIPVTPKEFRVAL